jgi:ATP/maltotriose-dependent transcriptional regulator MalT
MTIFGSQLVGLRWCQGRLDEVVDLVTSIATTNPGLSGLTGLVAMCLAVSAREGEAAPLLSEAAAAGFDAPYDMFWLPTLVVWAEVAWLLDDVEAAAMLYGLLEPWHAQFVFSGTNGQGAVALYLGHLAIVLGRLDDAERYLEESADIHARLDAGYFVARTDLAKARLLAARGERRAAGALAAAVRERAAAGGFTDVSRWAAALART